MRPAAAAFCLIASIVLCQGCTTDSRLAKAERNYPPLIIGANTHPTDGTGPFARACPSGGYVQQRGGNVTQYMGADPSSPDLCRMLIGGQPVEGWFGIWLTIWPGEDKAHVAMGRVIRGRTGDIEGFDVNMGPGRVYHDILRNEGVEDIVLLGKTYHALKISHYREGAEENIYRSVVTGWKDIDTGMLIYVTYQHIAGPPEINVPLVPTAIVPGHLGPQPEQPNRKKRIGSLARTQ